MISIEQLNGMEKREFVATLATIFEHSPWVAERAAAQRPFLSRLDLLDAMTAAVSVAAPPEQLALIRAHPRLGVRPLGSHQLTPASAREQSRAGLTACTPAEFERLEQLNDAYVAKFNFPFILAVRGHNPASVITAIERRLKHNRGEEQQAALRQIGTIAGFRLADLLQSDPGQEIAAMARWTAALCAKPASGQSTHGELAAMFSEWMLAVGLTVWQEAGGYLLGQSSDGRADSGNMVLGIYLDATDGTLWAADTLDILIAVGVAQQLPRLGQPHPFRLTIVASPQSEPMRNAAGLLDTGHTLRWVQLSAGKPAEALDVALRSALNQTSVFAGVRVLARTRAEQGDLGLPVDASQAAQAVKRIADSFAAGLA